MYTPYLMSAYATALLVALMAFVVLRRTTPHLRGLGHLQRFVICGLVALGLFALRGRIPILLTVVAANFVLFVGVLSLYGAATEILEVRKRALPWLLALCAAALPAMLWFTYAQNSTNGRLEIHCVVLFAVFTVTSSLLFRHKPAALRYATRACAWLMGAGAGLNAGWALYGLLARPNPNMMHLDAVDAGFSYLTLVLGLGNAVALAWLSLCAHRQELQVTAQTDALTGLLNRGAFEEILRRELGRSERSQARLGMLLLDVDYFKLVNDAHGHLVGDDVLRRISDALRVGTRPADVLARFGGEEFVILLRNTVLDVAEEVAERLRADIAALTDLPGSVNLTASFGVAVSQPGETAGQFLVRVDEALYRSKREGRNLVRVDRPVDGESQGIRVVARS